MECQKCGYEIEEGEAVYCQSCFELALTELYKLQKENQRLKDENKSLKNKIEIMKLERGRKWKGRRRSH